MGLHDSVVAALEALGLHGDATIKTIACDEALADTAAFCAHYGYSPGISANCILVVGKSDPPLFAACMVLATHRLDVNGVVRKRLGTRKASFADAGQTVALTGMAIGGVTPFGLPASVPLWVDAAVLAVPEVIVGGGSRTAKLLLPPERLLLVSGAEAVQGLAAERN